MRLIAAIVGLAALAMLGIGYEARTQEGTRTAEAPPPGLSVATFAGGCFWCMEPPFDKLEGVVSTTSGYTGGSKPNPSYKEVSAGGTGHTEAVRVVFDPSKVSYEKLLDVLWRNIDPLDARGQFCDKGDQYRPAIFTHDPEQERLARQSKAALDDAKRFGKPTIVEVEPAAAFYVAEDYHQDYYQKNPLQYRFYRFACGRDARLEEVWGKAGS
jgi:peptide-methionine (S)-S-oxide reductase